MSNVTNLKNGSSGSDVKKLQKALISAGYDVGKTGADGILGKNTEAAIKQYQKDNGLAVDGIAGKITQGSLYSTGANNNLVKLNYTNTNATAGTGSGNAGAVNDAPIVKGNEGANEVAGTPKVEVPKEATNEYIPSTFTYQEFAYNPFEKSDTVKQADAILAAQMANKPGAWSDPYYKKYMGYLNQYENRDPFSYDFNSDALYQQYKDQYIQQGQLAMMDTMGQAAAMTGGYGNSYAQAVGQQAYNQQLGQLNEIMPELYNMAYNRYNQEGQDLLNLYSLYNGLSEQDYNKYLGEWDRYYNNVNLARNYANDLYQNEFNEWYTGNKMDFDVWNANTGLAFDEWKTTEDMRFTDYTNKSSQAHTSAENEKNRQWQTEENDKGREEDKQYKTRGELIDLIENHGYQPTDDELAAAGITREQANAYLNTYNEGKKDTAYKDAMGKIEMGIMPTEEELAAAGITPEEAAVYAEYYSNNSGTTGTTNTNANNTTEYAEFDYETQQKWTKEFERAGSLTDVDRIADMMEQAGIDPQIVANWRDYYAKQFEDEVENTPTVGGLLTGKTPTGVGGGGGGGTWYMDVR